MTLHSWGQLFVAVAGAGAALTGLIIVAISVNIKTMLAIPSMTSRAATTVATLTVVVIVACVGLFPEQSARTFGAEAAIISLLVLVLAVRSAALILRTRGTRTVFDAAVKGALGAIAPACTAVGGLLLVAGSTNGLYLVGASMLLIFATATTTVWVLLVEILR